MINLFAEKISALHNEFNEYLYCGIPPISEKHKHFFDNWSSIVEEVLYHPDAKQIEVMNKAKHELGKKYL